MSEIEHPIQSTASLLKALAIALVIAVLLFVTTVLPAEYGIDPTGIGSALGINNLAEVNDEPEIIVRVGEGDLPIREDETEILVPAGGGLEYKFFLNQYASLNYEWSTNAPLYFDLHGEPDGDTTGFFESYGAGTVDEMSGTITTPFAGSHGWYFSNSNGTDVTVSLKTRGSYEIIGLK